MYVECSKGNEAHVKFASKEIKNLDSVMPFISSGWKYKSQMREITCLKLQIL